MKSKDKKRTLKLQHDNTEHRGSGVLSENSFHGTFLMYVNPLIFTQISDISGFMYHFILHFLFSYISMFLISLLSCTLRFFPSIVLYFLLFLP